MPKEKFVNITSFSHNSTAYPGIRTYEVDVDAGEYEPDHDEGKLYPTGADNVGTQDRFPVMINVETEDQVTLMSLMAAGKGTTEFVGTPAGGNAAKKVTILNTIYRTARQRQGRGSSGRTTHNGFAVSADGDALPISIDAVV